MANSKIIYQRLGEPGAEALINDLNPTNAFETSVKECLKDRLAIVKLEMMKHKQREAEISKQKFKYEQMFSKPSLPFIQHESESDSDEVEPEHARLLEQENKDLLSQLEKDLDSLRTATQSISQVSEMQSALAMHLSTQSEVIDQIHGHAITSTARIQTGNAYLKEADRIFGGPKVWVLVVFLLLSFILLFLDYYYE